ncbi:hypothetical protein BDR26DRAFT_915588 [Obelidium mucronatum]|nr:hypothetical protein BDR26DRAFT_915588 [Obelidium mucronatum]
MAFTSVSGVAGKSSSNGASSFDDTFFGSVVISYLVGITISLTVNLLVYPEFAEQHLNENLKTVLLKTRDLSTSIIAFLNNTTETSMDGHLHEIRARNNLVVQIQTLFASIDSEQSQAASEITYSHFSLTDYARVIKGCKGAAAVLFSINTFLNAPESVALLMSRDYQVRVSEEMKAAWGDFDLACRKIFESLGNQVVGGKLLGNLETIAKLQETGSNALLIFKNHQPPIFTRIFDTAVEGTTIGTRTPETKTAWENLLQINFYQLAMREFISDLSDLHHEADLFIKSKKQFQLHFNWLTLVAELCNGARAQMAFSLVNQKEKSVGDMVRQSLFKFKNFLLSRASVKFFKEWYLGGCVSTIVVAISPSLGQTYLSLPLTILGTSAGAFLGFLSVSIFGADSYGHVGFSVFPGLVFSYLMLFNPKTASLGLLALLAFGNYVCVSLANSGSLTFDPPNIYLYKVITVLSCALTFSVIFTLLLYPTFARHILRLKISVAFHDLNMLYCKITSRSIRPFQEVQIEGSEIKDLRDKIFSQLVALEPLMIFASAEPRLESKFQAETYHQLIQCMYQLLDRLECARLSVGETPFDSDIISGIDKTEEILPLTGIMPVDKEGMLETLNSDRWMRLLGTSAAVREVSRTLDLFLPHLKNLFGEYPDIAVDEDDAWKGGITADDLA